MTSEQIQELVKKTLNAHYIEAGDEDAYAPEVEEQLAIARLTDAYTQITAVVEAEKKWVEERERKEEVFKALMESTDRYIAERGVPLVLMQMLAQGAHPRDSHIPEQVVELAMAMGAEVVCGCPECTAERKQNGH